MNVKILIQILFFTLLFINKVYCEMEIETPYENPYED